ncbi:MAG: hypothetical protein PHW24_03545 [Candidatus Moranbacteria bacterium]|nr:hypothetical protein [Candidatus Moranbacteria bacterium]
MIQSKTEEQKRGWRADVVAEIVRDYLVSNLRASIDNICNAVRKELTRKQLAIDVSPSGLRTMLVAEKRPFCLVRVPGEGMFVTLERSILLDIMSEMAKKSGVNKNKVRHLKSVPRPVKKIAVNA